MRRILFVVSPTAPTVHARALGNQITVRLKAAPIIGGHTQTPLFEVPVALELDRKSAEVMTNTLANTRVHMVQV